MDAHILGVDGECRFRLVGCVEADFVQHALHHGQSRRAPMFSTFEFTSTATSAIASMAVLGELKLHALGRKQRNILLDKARFRLAQDAAEIVAGQGLQFHADRQAALKLRQEVGRFRDMESAGRDEQDMVCFHRPVFRADGGAFDQRQQIALHALAADIRADALGAGGDLVDFVEEDDAVILGGAYRLLGDLLIVDKLVGLRR